MSAATLEQLDTLLNDLDVSLFAKDAAGAKSATSSLFDLCSGHPRAVLAALPKLEAALGDDNYSKRSALVHILATLAEQIQEGGTLSKDGAGPDADAIEEEDDDEQDDEMEAAAKLAAKASNAAEAAQELMDAKSHILLLLQARKHDINSFTRIKALQALLGLVRARAMSSDPAAFVATLRAAQDRLMDKTASVRKAAIQLLTALMEMNPFAGVLDLGLFRAQLQIKAQAFKDALASAPGTLAAAAKAKADAKKRRSMSIRAPVPEEEDSDAEPGADEEPQQDEEEEAKDDDESKEDGGAAVGGAPDQSLKSLLSSAIQSDLVLEKLRKELQTLFHAVTFLGVLAGEVLPVLHELLQSKTHSDQIECIHFFVVARQFQLSTPPPNPAADAAAAAAEDADADADAAAGSNSNSNSSESTRVSLSSSVVSVDSGCKKMAGLIWSREASVRDAVLEAFGRLYLAEDLVSSSGSSSSKASSSAPLVKKAALVSINSLVQLVLSSSLSDLTSLEEICTRLFQGGSIPRALVDTLWELAATTTEEVSATARAAFLTLLNFFANASGRIMANHVQQLVQVGFSDAALHSAPTLVRAACIGMQKWVSCTHAHTHIVACAFALACIACLFRRCAALICSFSLDLLQFCCVLFLCFCFDCFSSVRCHQVRGNSGGGSCSDVGCNLGGCVLPVAIAAGAAQHPERVGG